MPEKVIVIGSGPAAWAAAIYTARANLEPLVFEGALTQENQDAGRPPLGQLALTTEVENYPGFPAANLREALASAVGDELKYMLPPAPDHERWAVQGAELMVLMKQQALNFGTRTKMQDVVDMDLDVHPFKLTLDDGGGAEALALIIATGASANYLSLESEKRFKNKGVSACAVCDGALPRFRNKALAVVGGGDSAVEEADYLTKFAEKVYMIHRRDQLRASKIMADRAMENPKIEILWNRTVGEVLGNDDEGVTGVRLNSTVGEDDLEVEITGFFLAIGHTPNTGFLKGKLQTNEKGYLKRTTPHRTYTSVEGVFAAGDVADDYYRQAVTAAGSGCMAALDAERWLAAKGLH
jgi:thioredoxin reductase (NADPH)